MQETSLGGYGQLFSKVSAYWLQSSYTLMSLNLTLVTESVKIHTTGLEGYKQSFIPLILLCMITNISR